MNQISSESLSNERKTALSGLELDVSDSVLEYKKNTFLAEISLYEFFKQAWPIIEGRNAFFDNWHIQAIAEHLEACFYRQIKNLIINIPPRTGKPVGQFSLLHRKDGIRVFIKDIEVGEYVLTGEGRFRKVLAKYYQGEMSGYLIKTFSGREIFAENSHPFLTTEGWKEAKDLNLSDTLATIETKETFGQYMSSEEARFLGYLIGDGCLIGTACNITCADEIQLKDIIHCATFLGFNYRISYYKRKETHKLLGRISFSEGINKPRKWIREHGIYKKNSYTKSVPLAIFKANKEAIGNFIGAYIACDGSVADRRRKGKDIKIEISSVSRKLLSDVQHLFNRLGIRTSIRTKIRNQKTKIQGDVYISYTIRTREQDDVNKLAKIVPIYGVKQIKLLNGCLPRVRFESKYMGDPIVSIETGINDECYCLKIEEDETFTANDLIVHNTSLISIAFPAWVWIRSPEEKFLYTSYAHSLSKEHSLKCKNLISSNWYQERWGDRYKIQKNTEAYFDNDKKGHRNSTSVEGTGTGKGGNIIVLDDVNNVKDSMSKLILEKTNRYLDQVLSSRFDNPEEGVTIEVQQRIGMLDATGHLISNDTDKEQVMLILPARYEHGAKCKTVVLPMSNGKVWEDPRTEEGEVLCPERLPKKVLDRLEKKLGAYSFASQYQQRAAPLAGNIIKKAWFQWWKDSTPPQIEHVLQSWDTAISDSETSDFSACTTWGVFYDENNISNVILLSMWKGRLAYPALRAMAQRLYFDYRDTGLVRNPELKGRPIDVCLIEAKATGDPLIRDLRNAGIMAIPFNPTRQGDKEGRVQRISHLIEGGLVWVPAQSPNYTKLLPYADKFIEDVAVFPHGESRDVIDSMSQALRKLYDAHLIRYPKDERPIQPSVREIKVY